MRGMQFCAAVAALAGCLLIPAALPAAEDEKPEVISLLGRELYARPAQGAELEELQRNLAEAEREFKADPDDPEKIIMYGRRMAYLWRYHEAIEIFSQGIEQFPEQAMLYRHRGHRYISIRDFGRAVDDLTIASLLEDSDFDIWYHLALAQYLKGDFAAAEQSWLRCLGTALEDDPLIAVSNWLYITLRRQGKLADTEAVLARIHEDMEVVENGSYYALLLFYKGLRTEEQLQEPAATSELEKATIGYGLGCWHLCNNEGTKAEEYFRSCVSSSHWPAFGFIAAEAELARAAGH
jgi:tetratricopeptide (TPR) repeat protein